MLPFAEAVGLGSALHALVLTVWIAGLTASCANQRPDDTKLVAVGSDFQRVSLPSLESDRRCDDYRDYSAPPNQVLEVALDGSVTYVGNYPGDGPRQPWPAAELEARLRELGARMSQAPIAPGATEMAPDDPLFLRFDGRAPARILLEVLEAARSAWIWKVGLLYWTDQPPYECLLKTFLPPLDAPDDPPRILTLRADAEGGADVQRQGRSIDWRTEPPPLWNEEPQVAVAPDLSVMALIDVLRRWTPTRSITAAR